MPRLVVTLTMRPQRWRIISCTTARDSAIGALVCTATNSRHCSGVTSQNLIGFCRLSAADRRLPDPGIVDQDVDRAEPARAPPRRSARPRRRASDRPRPSAAPPPGPARARSLASAARPSAVRSEAATRIPASSSPRTSARPMPPAAPVTIAVRCLSLIPPLPLSVSAIGSDAQHGAERCRVKAAARRAGAGRHFDLPRLQAEVS